MTPSRITIAGWLIGLAALAFGVRWATLDAWLWYDELLSVAFAVQPFSVIASGALPDPHPPLYYAQLHAWLWVSDSDAWILANPVAWSVATVLLLFEFTRRAYGMREALTASLLFALSPFAIGWAQEARMYAMIGFWALAAWACYERWSSAGFRRDRFLFGGALAEIALAYSHLAGSYMLACVVAAESLSLLQRRPPRKALRSWLVARGCVGIVALPAIALTLRARAAKEAGNFSYAIAPGVDDVLRTSGSFFVGPTHEANAWQLAVLGSLSLAVALLGAARPRSRALALGLWVVPIAIAVGYSYLATPMWHVRLLAFAAPFLALLVALIVWEPARFDADRRSVAWRTATVAALLCSQAWFVLTAAPEKPVDFAAAVERMRPNLRRGDVVYLRHPFDGWAWSWYFAGPNPQRRLGRPAPEMTDGVATLVGKLDLDVLRGLRVWSVGADWHRLPELPLHRRASRTRLASVSVEQWLPASAAAER